MDAPADRPGRPLRYARHDQRAGGGSPLWRLMAPTTSQWQLRRREAGWEGSRRQTRDPRNTWCVGDVVAGVLRVEGGAVRASLPRETKPDAIKGPQRRRGGCARKVAGLIRGGLSGCRPRDVDPPDGGGREAAAHPAGVSRGRSSGGVVRREGPNAKPRRRTLVLAEATAANPAWAGPSRNGCLG